MATVYVTLDTTQVQQAMRAMVGRFPKAVVRARRRALTTARTHLARAVAADIKVKVGVVKDALPIVNTDAAGVVFGKFYRIELYDFISGSGDPRGPYPSRGKRVLRIRGKTYPGAFVAQMTLAGKDGTHSGHWGVYRRLGTSERKSKSGNAWSLNLPIVKMKGPSVWWAGKKHAPAAQAVGLEAWQRNLAAELNFAANMER